MRLILIKWSPHKAVSGCSQSNRSTDLDVPKCRLIPVGRFKYVKTARQATKCAIAHCTITSKLISIYSLIDLFNGRSTCSQSRFFCNAISLKKRKKMSFFLRYLKNPYSKFRISFHWKDDFSFIIPLPIPKLPVNSKKKKKLNFFHIHFVLQLFFRFVIDYIL